MAITKVLFAVEPDPKGKGLAVSFSVGEESEPGPRFSSMLRGKPETLIDLCTFVWAMSYAIAEIAADIESTKAVVLVNSCLDGNDIAAKLAIDISEMLRKTPNTLETSDSDAKGPRIGSRLQ
jgi:hypothetical protein